MPSPRRSTPRWLSPAPQLAGLRALVIRRGAVLQDRVEVFGLLKPGELVLARGTEELKDGARVTPREVEKNPK